MAVQLPVRAHAYTEACFDAHLMRTRQFLQLPSISAQRIGLRACADQLREWLAEQGGRVEFHGAPEAPIVLAEWNVGAAKTLLAYGMYDVQPADERYWSTPPFVPSLRIHPDGGPSIFARGACNSKGPLMAFLHAIESLRATGGLPVNIVWTIEGEEEIGSPALPGFYRENRDRLCADGAFEPFWSQWRPGEPPELALGTKGDVGLEIVCRSGDWGGPLEAVHSSVGPWVKSPAWRLVRALETMIDEQQNLNVEGIPCEAPTTPEDERLLAELARTFDPEEAMRQFGIARFRDDLSAIDLLRQIQFGTALNINGLVSGYTGKGGHTIIPHVARAKLDVRLPPGVGVQEVLDAIRAHLVKAGYPDIEIIPEAGYPAARTSLQAAVVRALVATYRAHGYEPMIHPLEPSATPYYLFSDILGLQFATGGLGAAGGSHGPDEWCSVDGLKDLEKSLATYLVAFAAA